MTYFLQTPALAFGPAVGAALCGGGGLCVLERVLEKATQK